MGQNLTGHTLPAEAACGNAMMDMGHDESLLILIKHCRDMKQQETRLRLVTLLLVLSCTTLFIFTISADLRQPENSGSSGQGVSYKTFSLQYSDHCKDTFGLTLCSQQAGHNSDV